MQADLEIRSIGQQSQRCPGVITGTVTCWFCGYRPCRCGENPFAGCPANAEISAGGNELGKEERKDKCGSQTADLQNEEKQAMSSFSSFCICILHVPYSHCCIAGVPSRGNTGCRSVAMFLAAAS